MNNHTWEDWCWNTTVTHIAEALNMDFRRFISRISVFCGCSQDLVYMLARLNDLLLRDKLNWRELTRDELSGIQSLNRHIIDYIDSNEEYVALIEQAMLAEGKEKNND